MADLLSRWRAGLAKTSKTTFGRIAGMLGATEIDEDSWDELEALLVQADLGLETAASIVSALKETVYQQGLTRTDELREALRAELRRRLVTPPALEWTAHPSVILVVGVNGSGKTTTIGKLAHTLKSRGKSVLLCAADTFRAAAIEQLEIWGERAGVEVIKTKAGGDPSAVLYDALEAAKSREVNYVIVDTAGRLHIDQELIDELKVTGEWLSDPNEYGPNWGAQRGAARARDSYCCQVCGRCLGVCLTCFHAAAYSPPEIKFPG